MMYFMCVEKLWTFVKILLDSNMGRLLASSLILVRGPKGGGDNKITICGHELKRGFGLRLQLPVVAKGAGGTYGTKKTHH
jgi:hypothetical protein